jgi:Protein of unknown function (DUF3955)
MRHTYVLGVMSAALGICSLILFSAIGSYVDADGVLHEPFGLIPLGFLAISGGVILLLVRSAWALLHTPTPTDKRIFAVATFLLLIGVAYLTASFAYLNAEAEREVSTGNS